MQWQGRTLVVTVRSPQDLPPLAELKQSVYGSGTPCLVQLSVIHNFGAHLD